MKAAIDIHPLRVAPTQSLLEVITLMDQGARHGSANKKPVSTKRSSYALVMDKEKLLGLLTERDIVKLTAKGIEPATVQVADVMTQHLITFQNSNLQNSFVVLSLFQQHHIRHLPIVNEYNQVVGVATPDSIRSNLQSTDLFKLRRVEDVMSTQLITATPESTALDLAQLMGNERVSCVVITQTEKSSTTSNPIPIGILTECDIVKLQSLRQNLSILQARSVMSAPLACLSPQDNLWLAHQTMNQLKVRRLVVTDAEDTLVGIVTQTSILKALDPLEMQSTISLLQQQVNQLKDERIHLLQERTTYLENQVQDTEQRFKAIFDQTFQFIGLLQTDGTLLEANQTALDFGGLALEDVIGKPFWESRWWSLSSDTQQHLKLAISQAAQGQFVRYEVDVLGVGEQVVTIDFSLTPVKDDSGQIILLIPEGHDITEKKALDQLKDEFISIINHELRTPLTSLQAAIKLLSTGKFGSLSEQGGRLLDIALINSVSLMRLVNDLLDIQRIESDKMGMAKQTCHATELMVQAAKMMEGMAQQYRVTISTTPISASFVADPERILQVLTNLLSNAIKFSNPGGLIWLTAKLHHIPNVSSLDTQTNDTSTQISKTEDSSGTKQQSDKASPEDIQKHPTEILFQVKDQGLGIPTDKLEIIFERFQQLDSSNSRQEGGTGLGLAICQKIIQRHKGRIWAESTLGEGSVFTFSLPL
ncbi:CBS domain-containing protein [Acaryochloris marina NIES-2412]|uniref:CBS domain-containing protein n=1 Tax=Acaryochloris marina TaxID=155978 RepID=UPI0040580221